MDEVRHAGGALLTPADTPCRNPAFDVTPGAARDRARDRARASRRRRPPSRSGRCWPHPPSQPHRSSWDSACASPVPRRPTRSSSRSCPTRGRAPARSSAGCWPAASAALTSATATSTRKLPCVLGHEVVGEVLAVGAGVTSVSPGDRVVVHHHAPCGACRRCRRGHETLCEQFRATKLDPGGFAEQVLVEAALVPELLALGTLDPIAATFVEPLGCVLRALDRAGLSAGDELLVVGAGSNGLLAIAAARERAAGRGLDPRAARRAPRARRGVGRQAARRRARRRRLPDDRRRRRRSAPPRTRSAPGGALCLYATTKPGAALGVDAELLFLRELTVCSSWSAGPARHAGRLRAARERPDRPACPRHAPPRPRRDRPRARPAAPRRGDQGRGRAVRAALLYGPGDLRVEEIAEPEGEVLVTVEAAAACATDVKCLLLRPSDPRALPRALRARDRRRARRHGRARARRRLRSVRPLRAVRRRPHPALRADDLGAGRLRRADRGSRRGAARDPRRTRAGGSGDRRAARRGRPCRRARRQRGPARRARRRARRRHDGAHARAAARAARLRRHARRPPCGAPCAGAGASERTAVASSSRPATSS